MDQRGGAKPQTPVKRRSRDDVTFGADGRARDTHAQHARKRRQIAISDDDESEFDEFDCEERVRQDAAGGARGHQGARPVGSHRRSHQSSPSAR